MSKERNKLKLEKRSSYPDLRFWLAFLLLNAFFFAPLTILFWGSETPSNNDNLLTRLLLDRPGYDLFRLNAEWLALMAIWCGVAAIRRVGVRILLWYFYLFAFAYYIYESVIVGFFGALPIGYNDYFLARDGLSGLLQHFDFPLPLVGAVVGLIVLAGFMLHVATKESVNGALHPASRVVLGVLAVFGIALSFAQPVRSAAPTAVVSSLTNKLRDNWQRSQVSIGQQRQVAEQFEARKAALAEAEAAAIEADDEAVGEVELVVREAERDFGRNPYDYSYVTLNERPDIYIIFLESYGDVLYSSPELRAGLEPLLAEMEQSLRDDGWSMASKLSWTPVFGGGSWLSYTTLLHGIKVDNEPLYNTLIEQSAEIPLPSMTRYLQTQGYEYNRVTPLPIDSDDEIAYLSKLKSFYGYDRWVTLNDMPYDGQLYGWGPAPPDQFSLAYLREVAKVSDGPSVNFFITHNSHAPWGRQPELVDDWTDLASPDTISEDDTISNFSTDHYFDAIDYQLRATVDFIRSEPTEDAIFVVVGDHQPPRINAVGGSPYTPMHVFGRNAEFINDFYFFNFEDSLLIDELDFGIRQEGFMSLFMRAFLGNFSDTSYDDLPPYRPTGLPLGNEP